MSTRPSWTGCGQPRSRWMAKFATSLKSMIRTPTWGRMHHSDVQWPRRGGSPRMLQDCGWRIQWPTLHMSWCDQHCYLTDYLITCIPLVVNRHIHLFIFISIEINIRLIELPQGCQYCKNLQLCCSILQHFTLLFLVSRMQLCITLSHYRLHAHMELGYNSPQVHQYMYMYIHVWLVADVVLFPAQLMAVIETV